MSEPFYHASLPKLIQIWWLKRLYVPSNRSLSSPTALQSRCLTTYSAIKKVDGDTNNSPPRGSNSQPSDTFIPQQEDKSLTLYPIELGGPDIRVHSHAWKDSLAWPLTLERPLIGTRRSVQRIRQGKDIGGTRLRETSLETGWKGVVLNDTVEPCAANVPLLSPVSPFRRSKLCAANRDIQPVAPSQR